MSTMRSILNERKKSLLEELKPLRKLESELEEVEKLLAALDETKRGGWGKEGHKNGCRCRECDPFW